MEYGDRPDIISNENWDFAFYGNEIDDRCKDAIEYSKTNSFCQILAIYHPETYQLVFDGSEIKESYEIADYLKERGINEKSKIKKRQSCARPVTTTACRKSWCQPANDQRDRKRGL